MKTPLEPVPRRFIVVCRNDSNKQISYYGPFVSDRLAAEFADKLPLGTRSKIEPIQSRAA